LQKQHNEPDAGSLKLLAKTAVEKKPVLCEVVDYFAAKKKQAVRILDGCTV